MEFEVFREIRKIRTIMTASVDDKASLEPNGRIVRTVSRLNESSDYEAQPEDSETDMGQDVLDHVVRGMIYASLAITDDKEYTLEKTGKTNPWQVEAVKLITGSDKMAHKPLTTILKESMDLDIDCHIDATGVTIGGHFLDTQGYIAHNDKFIVLSYRCTTSAFDWMSNFNSTASIWEPEEDLDLGYSGFCSGFEGYCCADKERPRVHTGFYNNFLTSLLLIKDYISPLLQPDEPPRTLYVTGHSLGGGVATLAACYFLMEFDWTKLPHHFVNVTAGSPRALGKSMKAVIDERLKLLGDSVEIYRIVKGKDVVATVPPSILGFQHIAPPVVIKKDGHIFLKKHFVNTDTDSSTLKELALHKPAPRSEIEDVESIGEKTRYERMVAKVPQSLRDHMPDFYLRPLFAAKGIANGRELEHPPLHDIQEESEEHGRDPPARKRLLFGKKVVSKSMMQKEVKTKKRKNRFGRFFKKRNPPVAAEQTR